jgi:hypothetical protein
MVEALVHCDDLKRIDRGLYVLIHSIVDGRYYSGRIVEGPFYDPDALKRDATPVQFIILNQGVGKVLSLLWPLPMRFGLPPVAFLRFKVGTLWEDIVLWTIIFLVGFGVGAGFLGL